MNPDLKGCRAIAIAMIVEIGLWVALRSAAR